MKKLVAVWLVGLLLVGCEIGDDPSKSDSKEEASSPSREAEASEWPDLRDPQALSAVAEKAFERERHAFEKGPDGLLLLGEYSPFTGWLKVTRANGQLEGIWHLEGGKLHGPGAFWYPNGQMQSLGYFNNGLHEGRFSDWIDSGQEISRMYFKDDQLDGLSLAWYWNGQRSTEEIYREGRLVAAMAWTSNGLECPLSRVKNGNGLLVLYHGDGTIDRKIEFRNGLEVE